MKIRTVITMGQIALALAVLASSLAEATAREVRVGIYNNPPKIMAGADGQPSGILGELLSEVARLEGWTLKAVPCEWGGCLGALESGAIDLLPDVAYNEARHRSFGFHRVAALHSWSQVYRREGVRIQSMLDLQDKAVTVLEGSVQKDYLGSLLAGFGLRTRLLPVRSFDEAFARVAAGEADAAAVNSHFGDQAASRYKLVETSLMFQPSRLFYATGVGRHPDLLEALDRRLEPWQADPESFYFKTLRRWGVPPEPPTVPTAFWWGLAGVAGLLLMALGIVTLLRREVARQTHELRTSEDKLSTILNSVDAHIFIKDTELCYQYANRKLCEYFGRPLEEIVGHKDEMFFDAASAGHLHAIDRRVLESGERMVEEELGLAREGQHKRTFLTVKLPLVSPENEIYALCGIATDITEQRRFIQEIHQLAFYDTLTHLPNRRQLMERLQQRLAGAPEMPAHLALLLVNLDNFQDLNDTHGHGAGDLLLQQVAQRLTACARAGDLVARLGGDEFAFLITELKPSPVGPVHQVEQAARSILHAISDTPCQVGDLAYQASASMGIAMLADAQASVEAVLKHADLALCQAKARGRNTIRFFRPDMEAVAAARAALEADLREGLARQQFLLYYQPQVDVHNRIFGVEALVRWQHPQRGLVAPGSFIGLAEASGLIEPLGLWILRTACRQIRVWGEQPATAHLQVAVNISARQLHHADFVSHVLGILDETGANPGRLELELTESHLLEDVEGAIAKMQAIKAKGVRISLDDFGTGYSSLAYLKRLPLDQLKIDQSFVRDLLIDASDMAIVRAIVGMGSSLRLSVLAEGVETQAQRDMLAQLGCVCYQGYLFGYPVPVADLDARLAP